MSKQACIEDSVMELQRCLDEKNQVIKYLEERIDNQEKQIYSLLMDSQEKHFHEIKKYYVKSIQRYLKNGKYLLLEIDINDSNGIYLPKCAKVAHFGEIAKDPKDNESKKKEIPSTDTETKKQEQEKEDDEPSTPTLRQKQSSKIENSFKGLSKEIIELKQKIKAYSTALDQKVENVEQSEKTPEREKKYGNIHQLSLGNNSAKNKEEQQSNKKDYEYVKQLQTKIKKFEEMDSSISPLKKKSNTKVLYIRK